MRRLAPLLGLLALTAALAAGPLGGGPAWAEPPSALSSQVTDSAGVLDDAAARTEVADLQHATGVRLYVVFVKTFDGSSGSAWAGSVAKASDFGSGQIVLAVATDDRKYGYSGQGGGVTGSDVERVVVEDVRPKLADSDWDGAVAAATGGLQGAAEGSSPSGSPSGSSSGSWVVLLVVGLVFLVVIGIIVAVFLALRRSARRQGSAPAWGPTQPPAAPETPLPELLTQADTALVRTDDAVASSAQELSFARAEFGEEATAAFASALADAQGQLKAAFTARRQLDDESDDRARRALAQEVVRRTQAASSALAAQSEAFTALRDVEGRLPQVVSDLRARRTALQQRIPEEQWRLERLGVTWSPAALRPVAGNVEQAARLLEAAAGQIDDAEAKAASDPGQAAVVAHAVEGALTQTATLLDAVTAREDDLGWAAASLADATAETDADLAQARGMLAAGQHDPALAGLVARAETARAAAHEAASRTGGVDPLAALRSLQEADAALDAALQGAGEAGRAAQRAAASLAQALPAARAEVAAARSYVDTRRGAVGTEARSVLVHAEQLLDDAERNAATDPVAALSAAQRADALAGQAQQLADDDVDSWSSGDVGPGAGWGGRGRGAWGPGGWGGRGWGGGGFGRGYGGIGGGGFGGGGFGGGGFEGAVLGGILGGMLSGGSGNGDSGDSDSSDSGDSNDSDSSGWSGGGDFGGGGGGGFGGGDSGGGDSGGGSF